MHVYSGLYDTTYYHTIYCGMSFVYRDWIKLGVYFMYRYVSLNASIARWLAGLA